MVYAVGLAQIVSWGTLFYAIGVLGPQMSRELGVSELVVFGGFTVGLVVSGLCAPVVGRMIDQRGGRFVMSNGSIAAGVALAALGLSWNAASVIAGWALAGAAMSATLYDAAFATLSQQKALNYRSAVTTITIMGALASTVFWPASFVISEAFGWRITWLVYAALQLTVCLPVHLSSLPRVARSVPAADPASPAASPAARPPALGWLTRAFALASFVLAVVVIHMIDLLQAAGLTHPQAVALAMLIGPMQVVGRLAELALAKRFPAVSLGYLPFVLVSLALPILMLLSGAGVAALAFVAVIGLANGILTVARGTVPHELFGAQKLGELLGRMARLSLFARAMAPASLSAMAAIGYSHTGRLGTLLGLAIAGLACYAVAVRARATPAAGAAEQRR